MNHRTAAAIRSDQMVPRGGLLALACAAFGFSCACPILLVSGVNMRLTDAACAFAGVLAVWDLLRRGRWHPGAARLAPVLLASIGWIGVELYFSAMLVSKSPSRMVLVRWLLALPAGYWLCIATEDPALRRTTLWGLGAGWCADTVLLAYDYVGFQLAGFPAFIPDQSRVTWVGNDYRALGIFDHPNAAAIGSLYLVPLLIGLAEERGRRGLLAVLGWVATLGVFYMTRSRGAGLTAIALLLAWSLARMGRMARLWALLAVLGVVALFLCWPTALHDVLEQQDIADMLSRFTDSDALRENSAGRSDTIMASLQLALTHPLGMGSTYGPVLGDLTGEFEATHNGILQLALLGGVPLALLVLAVLLRGAWRVWLGAAAAEHWIALYFLSVAMFEEAFFIPTVSIVTLWLVARLGWPLFGVRPSPVARARKAGPSWPR